jgi:hypothetical protein
MTPRPGIFVSAVSKELKAARQLVSNTLQFLGYEPVWQDIFGTEQGDLRAMLRQKIDDCKGVVQLVGRCYGAEPPAPDEQFGRVSYTQYEALYARQRGKKVWYLVLDEGFPGDAPAPEPAELGELQAAYRRRLQADSHLYHPLASREALETSVLKLRDDLSRLRRGVRQWAVAVLILLVTIVGAVVWLERGQWQANRELAALKEEMAKLREGVARYADVQAKVRQEKPGQTAEEVQQRTYEELAKQLDLDPRLLQEKLPQYAAELKKAPGATTFERANAAYVDKDYGEAERLALVAADEARNKQPPDVVGAIRALELAGNSADARVEYADALKYFRDAAQLTDRARDPFGWAGPQWHIGQVLEQQGKYAEAEKVYREVLNVYRPARGENDPDVLSLCNEIANVLDGEGDYAEVEKELRPVIRIEEKIFGPKDPRTLASRHNLCYALDHQGKYAEAVTEDREVIRLRTEILGPQNPDTLKSRNILVLALNDQGEYVEAEQESREIIALRSKVLGPKHPDTLASRHNLAFALDAQGKFDQAGDEYQEVVRLKEQVLGPEHPNTLASRTGLANTLRERGHYAEAEAEYRSIIRLKEKVLGSEHPSTLAGRNGMANTLRDQGLYAEAETEYREVLKLREKVLGPEHPDTLQTCYGLALCLKSENKLAEAETFARRAADGAKNVLAANHPDALKYKKLWQELQANNQGLP